MNNNPFKRKTQRAIRLVQSTYYILKFLPLREMRNRFKTRTANLYGMKVWFNDSRSFFYEVVSIFKDEVYHFITENNAPIIIDGGGFIGMATLYFKKLYPKSRIMVFEPDAEALVLLRRNISENHLEDITVVESGLSDLDGDVGFRSNTTDGNRIVKNSEKTAHMQKLSNFAKDRAIDFMKLNIEGAELSVLSDLDAADTLRNVQKMCIEWHSFRGEPQNLDRVLAILSKNGFRYHLASFSNARKGRFSAKETDQFYLIVYAERISQKN